MKGGEVWEFGGDFCGAVEVEVRSEAKKESVEVGDCLSVNSWERWGWGC